MKNDGVAFLTRIRMECESVDLQLGHTLFISAQILWLATGMGLLCSGIAAV